MDQRVEQPEILPKAKREGIVKAVYRTQDDDSFETVEAAELHLGFEGIPGDRHAGVTRKSGGREPWYPRGMEMRNERQLSLLCPDELSEIAAAMALPQVRAEWIGGNVLMDGIRHFSFLPPDTLLFFEGGVTLAVQRQNGPCRFAGAAIAKRFDGRDGLDLLFPKVAKRLRGLVAWVEKPGTIKPGEAVEARIPEQWIYR
ncbi:MAG: molybdenum cofactor sulfurase [Hyphomicrobiales bacterium]|nr:molybdenum cofactor sulfurase [Hyphomicrobiales bacterium]